MKIEYTKHGDYYLPNLSAPEKVNALKLGKYGRMRLRFLQENRKAEYTILFINNKLQKHLIEIDEIANARFELLMKQFMEKENVTEELKATNPMEWVCKMNNIRDCVQEIILKELIYV